MALKMHTAIEDCGDGTQHVLHFSSKEAAEHYIEKYDWSCGPAPDEAHEEEFTLQNGVLRPASGFDDREDFDG